jgi:hypothetical protein
MKYWQRYWNWLWELEREHGGSPGAAQAEQVSLDHSLPRARRGRFIHGDAGRPLPPQLRARLEASLGVDLSSVRLFVDAQLAQALGAEAIAIRDMIVLRQDAEDRELLAHEAIHIAQARARGMWPGVSRSDEAAEREADSLAHAAADGTPVQLASGGPVPLLARKEDPEPAKPAGPQLLRDTVRALLLRLYQRQGGKGAFQLTTELERELARLVPGLTAGALALLWQPAPDTPMVAFNRLVAAGYLPDSA